MVRWLRLRRARQLRLDPAAERLLQLLRDREHLHLAVAAADHLDPDRQAVGACGRPAPRRRAGPSRSRRSRARTGRSPRTRWPSISSISVPIGKAGVAETGQTAMWLLLEPRAHGPLEVHARRRAARIVGKVRVCALYAARKSRWIWGDSSSSRGSTSGHSSASGLGQREPLEDLAHLGLVGWALLDDLVATPRRAHCPPAHGVAERRVAPGTGRPRSKIAMRRAPGAGRAARGGASRPGRVVGSGFAKIGSRSWRSST